MKKYNKGEIAEMILSLILATGVVAVAGTMPNAVQLFKYFKPRNTPERDRIKKSLISLEKQGLVMRKNVGEDGFILTTKGEEKALRHKLEVMKITHQDKWDGKWRIVMFDVSENKKQARRSINFALKKLGCVQYQKSVFITPFPCKEEIDFVGRCFNVRKDIKLILAERIEGDDILRKTFKI